MRIGIVGGVGRNQPQLYELAARAGHVLEVHDGDVGGRGAVALAALVRRADLVVIAMEVNSHGAVRLARRLCKSSGTAALVLRTASPARVAELLTGAAAPDGALAATG
ncbi:MAG: DUF2325 domain-containing protein [Polyangiaceae bacterium]|nr:DUF2325 domain-containing protein [Polyangiaceae bacterium]